MRVLTASRRAAVVLAILAASLLWPAGSAAAPATASPSNTCFVLDIYSDLLGRPADSSGLTAGLVYLGTHTRQDYAGTLLVLDEYRAQLIRGWFGRFLGRPPSNAEIDTWLSLLDGGARDEAVMAIILGSGEYFNQPRVGGNNTNFVNAIYSDLLHRSPDQSGLSAWLAYLATHTRLAMAQSILASDEYYTVIVQGWYQQFLGRAAGAGELSAALTILKSVSGTDEQVIAIVVGSQEYFARAGLCRVYAPLIGR